MKSLLENIKAIVNPDGNKIRAQLDRIMADARRFNIDVEKKPLRQVLKEIAEAEDAERKSIK